MQLVIIIKEIKIWLNTDKVVAFCKDGEITNGTKSALEYCEKINKKYVILD